MVTCFPPRPSQMWWRRLDLTWENLIRSMSSMCIGRPTQLVNEVVAKNMVMIWHNGDIFLVGMKDLIMLDCIQGSTKEIQY